MIDYNFKEHGVGLLLPQFDNSPKVQGLVKSFLEPADQWLQGVNDLLESYNIDKATGEQLDLIGSLYSFPRLNRDDETYRKALKVRIITARATGKSSNFIDCLKYLLGENFRFDVLEFPSRVQVICYGDQDIITDDVVKLITPVGVGATFFTNPYEDKVIWTPCEVDEDGEPIPTPEAVLPEIEDLATTDMVIIELYLLG